MTKGNPRLIFRCSGADMAVLREMAKIRNCTVSELMREALHEVMQKYRYDYYDALKNLQKK